MIKRLALLGLLLVSGSASSTQWFMGGGNVVKKVPPPTNVALSSQASDSITVSWSEPAAANITEYRIKSKVARQTGTDEYLTDALYYTTVATITAPATSGTATHNKLNGYEWDVCVSAYDGVNESDCAEMSTTVSPSAFKDFIDEFTSFAFVAKRIETLYQSTDTTRPVRYEDFASSVDVKRWEDLSSNNLDMTFTDVVEPTYNTTDGTVSFNNTADGALQFSAIQSFTGEFTCAFAWEQPASLTSRFLRDDVTGTDDAMRITSTVNIKFRLNGTAYDFTSGETLSGGTDYYVVWSRNSSDVMQASINGVEMNELVSGTPEVTATQSMDFGGVGNANTSLLNAEGIYAFGCKNSFTASDDATLNAKVAKTITAVAEDWGASHFSTAIPLIDDGNGIVPRKHATTRGGRMIGGEGKHPVAMGFVRGNGGSQCDTTNEQALDVEVLYATRSALENCDTNLAGKANAAHIDYGYYAQWNSWQLETTDTGDGPMWGTQCDYSSGVPASNPVTYLSAADDCFYLGHASRESRSVMTTKVNATDTTITLTTPGNFSTGEYVMCGADNNSDGTVTDAEWYDENSEWIKLGTKSGNDFTGSTRNPDGKNVAGPENTGVDFSARTGTVYCYELAQPLGASQTDKKFLYNFSLDGPQDSNGKTMPEWMADWSSDTHLRENNGGAYTNLDATNLTITYWDADHVDLICSGGLDGDNDGTADNGWTGADGVNRCWAGRELISDLFMQRHPAALQMGGYVHSPKGGQITGGENEGGMGDNPDCTVPCDLRVFRNISNITQANPAVVTTTADACGGAGAPNPDWADNDTRYISGVVGMTEVNDRVFTINCLTNTTFELVGEDSTSHTAYTSGGSVHDRGQQEYDKINISIHEMLASNKLAPAYYGTMLLDKQSHLDDRINTGTGEDRPRRLNMGMAVWGGVNSGYLNQGSDNNYYLGEWAVCITPQCTTDDNHGDAIPQNTTDNSERIANLGWMGYELGYPVRAADVNPTDMEVGDAIYAEDFEDCTACASDGDDISTNCAACVGYDDLYTNLTVDVVERLAPLEGLVSGRFQGNNEGQYFSAIDNAKFNDQSSFNITALEEHTVSLLARTDANPKLFRYVNEGGAQQEGMSAWIGPKKQRIVSVNLARSTGNKKQEFQIGGSLEPMIIDSHYAWAVNAGLVWRVLDNGATWCNTTETNVTRMVPGGQWKRVNNSLDTSQDGSTIRAVEVPSWDCIPLVRPYDVAAGGPSQDFSSDLESYWSFDETSGSRADSYGNNDTTDNSSQGSTTGLINNAGVLSDVGHQTFGDLNWETGGKIWINFDIHTPTTGAFSSGSSNVLFGDSNGCGASTHSICVYISGSGNRIRCTVNTDGTDRFVQTNFNELLANTTYNYQCYYDHTDGIVRVKIDDGTEKTSAATTGNLVSGGTTSYIAQTNNGAGSWIDNVFIGYFTPTAQDSTDAYNSGSGYAPTE